MLLNSYYFFANLTFRPLTSVQARQPRIYHRTFKHKVLIH